MSAVLQAQNLCKHDDFVVMYSQRFPAISRTKLHCQLADVNVRIRQASILPIDNATVQVVLVGMLKCLESNISLHS